MMLGNPSYRIEVKIQGKLFFSQTLLELDCGIVSWNNSSICQFVKDIKSCTRDKNVIIIDSQSFIAKNEEDATKWIEQFEVFDFQLLFNEFIILIVIQKKRN